MANIDNILTADGRSVGFTPRLRAVIHPDDREVCAEILRSTYRSLRAAGWDRRSRPNRLNHNQRGNTP